MDPRARLTISQRLILVLLGVAAFAIGLWPTWLVRDAALARFGMPAYEGVWILIPHALLYSTLSALFCALTWLLLQRVRWLDAPSFALNGKVVIWGVIGAAVALASSFGVIFATGQGSAVHAPEIDPWLMAGNVFSNFFEELVFRGFILAALTAALGFWPAAVLSSMAFGAVHTQFPLELQILIGLIGLMWCLVLSRAKSLLAPYISHMLLDWAADPFL